MNATQVRLAGERLRFYAADDTPVGTFVRSVLPQPYSVTARVSDRLSSAAAKPTGAAVLSMSPSESR
jgi:hypothetical protein